jgi:hypothetical protein
MSLQPFLLQLKEILGEENFIMFFVDDGNLIANHEQTTTAIEYIFKEGPKYGYNVQKLKGSICLGSCNGDWELAQLRQREFIDRFGFDKSIVHIHPDDFPDAEEFGEAKASAENNYGMVILGAFVGTDSYVRTNLAKHVDAFEAIIANLERVDRLQYRFLLLRHCFCPKIIYLLRNTRSDLTEGVISAFESFKKRIYLGILEEDSELVDKRVWDQSQLSIEDGGMGLHNTEWIQSTAFAASFLSFYQQSDIRKKFGLDDYLLDGGNKKGVQVKHIMEIEKTFNAFNGLDPSRFPDIATFLSMGGDKSGSVTVQSTLTDYIYKAALTNFNEEHLSGDQKLLAWVTSLRCAESGRWIAAAPKTTKYRFTNKEYQVSIRFRLFLPIPQLVRGISCNCKARAVKNTFNRIDETGHHFVSGCAKTNSRNELHNIMERELASNFRYCGLSVITEELDCFKNTDPNSNKRPDLSIDNTRELDSGEDRNRRLILDFSLTGPIA